LIDEMGLEAALAASVDELLGVWVDARGEKAGAEPSGEVVAAAGAA
jgi:hypothetical protein